MEGLAMTAKAFFGGLLANLVAWWKNLTAKK
jgi:hypothetical protein